MALKLLFSYKKKKFASTMSIEKYIFSQNRFFFMVKKIFLKSFLYFFGISERSEIERIKVLLQK